MNKLVLWFVKITGYIPHLFYFKKKIYYVNKQNSSRKIKGSAIIISNHKSVFDFALYMFVFPFRDIYTLIGEVMFEKGKLFAWFLKKLGGIKVERQNFDFDFINKASEKLEKGKVLEIYPEARLPLKHEKKILPFKPSFVYLALETNAPIIPVYTNGEYNTRKRTKVLIGEKIYLRELYDDTKSEKENIDYLCNYVRDYIERLEGIINEKTGQK
jgi:1-acyl-sn-glycerol-3-phosphate acyltransferase